ncbi:MAG: 2-oxo acid dehydrogenase subunit E2 [Myxococcaceae bacterium]
MKTLGWRRIAGAMWRAPNDPQIYGAMEVDATAIVALIERARAAGVRLTPTHLVGRAVAFALHELPDFNVRIRGARQVPRRSVDVFFITAVGGGRDLSGVKIAEADRKPIAALASELAERASDLKAGRDPDFTRSKRMFERLPLWLLRPLLHLVAWFTGDHDRSLKLLSLKASPFGSAMVSSVGMFGLPMGFAPLAWMYKVPLLVLAGELTRKPVAVDGHVEVRPMLPLTATIDHRYADGWHIARLVEALKAYLAEPARFEAGL